MLHKHSLPILLIAGSGLLGGCDLATTDIDAEVKVDFTVDATDAAYNGDFTVDANENADVKDNRSKIKSGDVTDITIEITSVDMGNMATSGDSQLYFRRFEAGTWAPGSEGAALVNVGTTNITQGLNVPITPDAAKKTELADIIFAETGETRVQMRFKGMADHAPVKFHGRATFKLKVKVGL